MGYSMIKLVLTSFQLILGLILGVGPTLVEIRKNKLGLILGLGHIIGETR